MPKSNTRVIDPISSVQDHIAFLTIFLIGAIAIFCLRLFTNLHTLVVLIIPILLIVVYMWFVNTNRHRLREDRAADNVYYLGFLFTMTTLAVSLVRYQQSQDPNIEQIIGDLGVGLITTIFGLLGRIFLGQLRQDPEEVEERGRLELTEAVGAARSKFTHMNEQVSYIQTHTLQIMKESRKLIEATNKGELYTILCKTAVSA